MEDCIMLKGRMTRRRFLATTAAATAIAMPYVRGAHAAGKLSMGFWDHWVPGANNTTTALVNEWAEKEKVEVSIDYITSVGNKNLLTIAAESQAKSGHDIFAFPTWESIRRSTTSHARTVAGSRCRPPSAARSRGRARASIS
jgi:ABC-type glycerol-3-phosphate transport system substrate-binding protein